MWAMWATLSPVRSKKIHREKQQNEHKLCRSNHPIKMKK